MHSRKPIHRVSLLTILAVLPIACQEQQIEEPKPREPIEQPSPLRTGWEGGGGLEFSRISFGGKPAIGPFKASAYEWHDEQRWLFLSVATYPGKAQGPVALVIARIPPGSKPSGGNTSSGARIFTIRTELDSKTPGRADAEWALKKDLQQSMHIGGTEYDLKQGRVFLVDAKGKSISVHQIAADLGGTFDAPGPDFEKLATEIESLRKHDVRVKRFWMGDDPDAEDS